jgi:hypothetical protein
MHAVYWPHGTVVALGACVADLERRLEIATRRQQMAEACGARSATVHLGGTLTAAPSSLSGAKPGCFLEVADI